MDVSCLGAVCSGCGEGVQAARAIEVGEALDAQDIDVWAFLLYIVCLTVLRARGAWPRSYLLVDVAYIPISPPPW